MSSAAATPFPHAVATVDDAAAVERLAVRIEVPCEEGAMVWRRWGESDGGGAPVVLLHGGAGSWNHWVRNIGPLVAAGRQVWVPDLPGFGESARPAGCTDADALPGPVEAGLQAVLGDAACDLVGFSFGGMVAGFVAAQFPRRVRRLVLVGAAGLGIARNPVALQAWRHLPEGPARQAAWRGNLASLMLASPESIGDLAVALHGSNLSRDRMLRRRIARTDVLRRTLPDTRCPVHGIWGTRDALYSGHEEALAPALAAAPGFGSLVFIADAGHWVQFERAPVFDDALAAALGPPAGA